MFSFSTRNLETVNLGVVLLDRPSVSTQCDQIRNDELNKFSRTVKIHLHDWEVSNSHKIFWARCLLLDQSTVLCSR